MTLIICALGALFNVFLIELTSKNSPNIPGVLSGRITLSILLVAFFSAWQVIDIQHNVTCLDG
jgi:hypothetical protein